MDSWTGHEVPRLPGTGAPLALFDSARRAVHPTRPGRPATMYVCGITPYDATHLGHAATMITFDLVAAGLARRRPRGAVRAERHRHRRPAAGAGQPRRRGLDRPGDARDRPVPRGHGGAADHPAGALRRGGRVDPRDRRQGRATCSTTGRRTGWTTAPATSTSRSPPRRGSGTSPTCPATRCWSTPPSAAATRSGPASATRSTRCCGAAPATASRPGRAVRSGRAARAGTSSAR